MALSDLSRDSAAVGRDLSTPARVSVSIDIALMTLSAVVCLLVFHGYQLFNPTLTIDAELTLKGMNPLSLLREGRWGSALWNWLLVPQTGVPITPWALGFGLYGLSFVMLLRRLEIRHAESIFIGACLFFGFPVLFYAFTFGNLVIATGFASLTAVTALYLARPRTDIRFALSAIFVALSISFYQSFLFFVVILFLADVLRKLWRDQCIDWSELWRQLFWYAAISIAGLMLYAGITRLSFWIFGTEPDYIQIFFFKPEAFIDDPLGVVQATLREIYFIYSGSSINFLGINFFYRILGVFCIAILVWNVLRRCTTEPPASLLLVFLLVGIAVSPFLQHLTNAGYMPYRSLVSVPAALAILAIFAAEALPCQFRRWLLLPLTVLAIVQFSLVNNEQYYAAHWALERDKIIGAQILSSLEQLAPRRQNYMVAVVGALEPPNYPVVREPSSTLGASFFQWDGGNSRRVAAFLSLLSNFPIEPASLDEQEQAFLVAPNMPSWPASGSIRLVDEFFVVKLSEPTAFQLYLFCKYFSSTPICSNSPSR